MTHQPSQDQDLRTALIAQALETFQQRDGYHKAVIVEILEDFGSVLLDAAAITPAQAPDKAGEREGVETLEGKPFSECNTEALQEELSAGERMDGMDYDLSEDQRHRMAVLDAELRKRLAHQPNGTEASRGGGAWPAGYQETFDAIGKAVTVHPDGMLGISVKAFYRALSYPDNPTPPLSPDSTGPQDRFAAGTIANNHLASLRAAALTPSAPIAAPVRDDGAREARLAEIATFLFDRLDDIDTAEDIAKGDDALFRRLAHAQHRRRFEVASTDGYGLVFAAPAPAGDVPGEAQTEAPSGWKNEHCNGEPEAAETGDVLVSGALADIAAERRRQVEAEGWTTQHDDEHADGELALAAACYALRSKFGEEGDTTPPIHYPWDRKFWKVKTEREMLVIAGALVAAEIERRDRAAKSAGEVP